VPTAIVGSSEPTTPWNVCVYASTSTGAAMVTAPAVYTVAPVLTVTGGTVKFAVGSGSPATTGSGPSQGGQTITFSFMTGIPTAPGALLTASLGGAPVTNIVPIDSTSFTGVTSPHAAGAVALSVTTAAGTKTTTTTPYTYTYGITISPNTAATNTTPVLDIAGAGFSTITTWANSATTTSSTANGYVLLTDNSYYTQTFTNLNVYAAAKPPISYCNSVLPISDIEIICTLNLAAMIDSVNGSSQPVITTNPVPAGTYTITVINEGNDIDANEYSIISSGSTFTVAPF
jgi:hypothetical protein